VRVLTLGGQPWGLMLVFPLNPCRVPVAKSSDPLPLFALLVEVHSGGPGADRLTSLVRNSERAADKEKEGPRSVRCRGIGRGTRNGENASVSRN
jgi:hypothetical protein